MSEQNFIIETKSLYKSFPIIRSIFDIIRKEPQKYVRAVDGVSLEIVKGENIGLVGESGCGKSTLARSIIRLYDPTSGQVFLEGNDFTSLSGNELRKKRKDIQMIFQDPYSSLNPRMSVKEMLIEALKYHNICEKNEMDNKVNELLNMVGLSRNASDRFPGEFSGGQRQRVGIARALTVEPKVLLADEPVSALDVSIQAQIINLLDDLKKKLNLTIMFISHDLGVVKYVTNRVAVMYLGKIVEIGPTTELFNNPGHPYTKILINATPKLDPRIRSNEIVIDGEIPSPINVPSGCRFHPRCPYCVDICKEVEPETRKVGLDRILACHRPLTENLRGPLEKQA